MKTAIITGITGQDGPYLAKLLLENNYRVIGITRGNSNQQVYGLIHLSIEKRVFIEECDLTDLSSVVKMIQKHQPTEIYNLAAQSSVGRSFEQPIGTIQFNIISVLNLLEGIKLIDKKIKYYQASSSEMYGKVSNLPITETTPMHPLSPYAVSKASAYWIANNYRESYNMFVSNGVLFNHESYLRSHQFFVKKVIVESIRIHNGLQKELRVGNIDIKRDFGHAPEYVNSMWLILQQQNPDDYIICSGTSVFLRDIIQYVFDKLEIPKSKLIVDKELYRPTDIIDIYGDNSKAKKTLGWDCTASFFTVLDKLIQEELVFGEKETVI